MSRNKSKKQIIALMLTLSMFNNFVYTIVEALTPITVTVSGVTSITDNTQKITKTGEHSIRLNNLSTKDDTKFPSQYEYIDKDGYLGIIPRTNVVWATNYNVDKEKRTVSKTYTVTEKKVPETINVKETINGKAFEGDLPIKDVKYTVTKNQYLPIYKVETKDFTKQMTKQHQNISDDSIFPEEYSINEDGYKGTIPRTDVAWTGKGETYTRKYDDYLRSSDDDFPKRRYIRTNDGFSGYIYQDGGSRVISGSRSDSKTVTDSKTGDVDTQFPSSISYNSGGYSGTLYTTGNPIVISGVAGKSKEVTEYSDYIYKSASDIPLAMIYNKGGYKGYLLKTSADKKEVVTQPADTKKIGPREFFVKIFAGHIVRYKYTGNPKDGGYMYYNKPDSFGNTHPYWVPKGWQQYDGQRRGDYPKTYAYNEDGYTGTLTYSGVWKRLTIENDGKFPKNPTIGKIYNIGGTTSEEIYYSGTVSRPQKTETRYRGVYTGTVRSNDTRVFKQNYSGTVYKPDTRVWQQDYSGTLTKSVGDYNGTATYSGTLTKKTIERYDTVPVEWKAEVVYEGDIEHPWEDYNGIASYSGEVTKLVPIINVRETKLKQNRKVTFTLTNTVTPIPVDNTKTEFTITPKSPSITADKIKYNVKGNVVEAVFKEPGDYTIKAKVSNGKVIGETEFEIAVKPDEKPVANFNLESTMTTRNPSDNNLATIKLFDASFSPDDDIIARRTWKYKFDSNNDGSFSDETWKIISNTNEKEPILKVSKVGKYLVELEIQEEFSEPTIAGFVTSADRLTADTYTSKPMQEKVFEVDNIAPYVDFSVSEKQKADIVFTVGDAADAKTADLNSKVNSYVKSKLAANNVDANITMVNTVEENITTGIFSVNVWWPSNGADMDSHMYFYSNGVQQGHLYYDNKNLYGCSLDRDDTSGGTGEWLTLNFDAIPSYIDEIRFVVHPFSDSSAQTNIRLYKKVNGTNNLVIDQSQYVSDSDVYFGKLTKNANVWDFTRSNGEVIPGKVVTKTVKTLDEVLKEPTWRPNASHFLVNISDIQLQELQDNGDGKLAVILSKLLANSIDFAALGTNVNQAQFNDLIARNSGNGVFFDNNDMNTAMDNLGTYILNKIKGKSITDNTQYVLLGEDLNYKTFFNDFENDPEFQRKWQYVHDANYFENNIGIASYNNQWLSNPITNFDKVGKYNVVFQAQDNPVGTDDRFAEYRKWSALPPTPMKILVHRKPVAQFRVTASPLGSSYVINTSESSYDLDHMSTANNGIINKEWKWKKSTDTTWTSGQLPSTLPVGYDYIVQLRVQDSDGPDGQGVWSDPAVQYFTTRNINIAPVAQFEIAQNPLPISKTLALTDNSYDPNGDVIGQRQWTIANASGTTIYTGSTLPTNFASYGIGTYKITLKVRDIPRTGLALWSEAFSQTLSVIPDNKKPVANFNVTPNPVPVDVSVSYTDNSSDPDGDPIASREWQILKSGSSTWTAISNPPTDFTAYGVGTHQIRLRVKDLPSLPQLDPLWSDWCTKTVTVTAGNQKPVARFTVAPNPVPADEPVTYNDTSYDPEGKKLTDKVWQVKNLETNNIYEFSNQLPPTVFEETGWGANGDGVGTYEITLKVKDTSSNGLSPARWSDEYKQTLVVEDPLKITALSMTSIVNPPVGTIAPVNYPVATPTKIKAGYKMTFKVNTNGGDKVEIKLYANGKPLTVHTDNGDTDTITKATVRKNAQTTFSFWTDKDLPKGTVIDMKIILTKTKGDGTTKSLVNNELGNRFGIIVGSSKEDSSINLTH